MNKFSKIQCFYDKNCEHYKYRNILKNDVCIQCKIRNNYLLKVRKDNAKKYNNYYYYNVTKLKRKKELILIYEKKIKKIKEELKV